MCYFKVNTSQRVSSIRTRIKTIGIAATNLKRYCLREYLPLEQGLRPANIGIAATNLKTQRVSSIRTRIKTLVHLTYYLLGQLREYLPLEQGLRLT